MSTLAIILAVIVVVLVLLLSMTIKILEGTDRVWLGESLATDEHLARSGRVIEVLSLTPEVPIGHSADRTGRAPATSAR